MNDTNPAGLGREPYAIPSDTPRATDDAKALEAARIAEIDANCGRYMPSCMEGTCGACRQAKRADACRAYLAAMLLSPGEPSGDADPMPTYHLRDIAEPSPDSTITVTSRTVSPVCPSPDLVRTIARETLEDIADYGEADILAMFSDADDDDDVAQLEGAHERIVERVVAHFTQEGK